jgi:hypothetical protein
MGTGRKDVDADILISRVVDGEACEADWAAFRAMAERDGTLWRDLAEYQRDQAELAAAVQAAVAVADGVEAQTAPEMNRRLAERVRMVGSWGGWAAAAAIVLVWMTGRPMDAQNGGQIGQPQGASLLPTGGVAMTPADALQTYIEKGQEAGLVVAEVPARVLIEARPNKTGGYEVVYLRQIMERKQVRELNTWGMDDVGRAVPVKFHVPPAGTGGAF